MLCVGLIGLLVSVLLAFIWRILNLIDEYSGRKAKRQIQQLKEMNGGFDSSSSFNTKELYEIIKSGNLAWDTISKGDRVDFEKVETSSAVSEEDEKIVNTEDFIEDNDNSENGFFVEVIEEQTSLIL